MEITNQNKQTKNQLCTILKSAPNEQLTPEGLSCERWWASQF